MGKDSGKKKAPTPYLTADNLVFWLPIIGGVLAVICALPVVPWRYAQEDSMMGSRFPSHRSYTLFAAGGPYGQKVSWLKLKKLTCAKMVEFQQVSVASVIGTTVSSALGTGGAVVGCGGWASCKANATARCEGYSTMMVVGILVFVMLLIGGLAGCSLPFAMSNEKQYRNKKKKVKELHLAQRYTAYVSMLSFFCVFPAVVTWTYTSMSVMDELKRTAYYPYADVTAGVFVSFLASFILFASMCIAIYRAHWKEEELAEEEPEEKPEEYAAQDALLQQYQGTGYQEPMPWETPGGIPPPPPPMGY